VYVWQPYTIIIRSGKSVTITQKGGSGIKKVKVFFVTSDTRVFRRNKRTCGLYLRSLAFSTI
jgi:hypothetical protein